MGARISRQKAAVEEQRKLRALQLSQGADFPASDFRCSSAVDRKEWMLKCVPNLANVQLKQLVWPGTHDSAATARMGIPLLSRPLVQCQDFSIYRQLAMGTRVLDIRVNHSMHVCHGIVSAYNLRHVIHDVLRFLSETTMEFLILEIRTEYAHKDPPGIEKWLIHHLGDHLIHPQAAVFDKTVGELMPRRLICVWKPAAREASCPPPLWNEGYLRDDWIDTDLPVTKFESNMAYLAAQPRVERRGYFYRVENTATPQADALVVWVRPVTNRIRGFARFFISQAFSRGYADRLQILSCDFIDEDFVDACVGVMRSRLSMEEKATAENSASFSRHEKMIPIND